MKLLLFLTIVVLASVGMSMLRGKTVNQIESQVGMTNTDKMVLPALNRNSELNTGYSDATQSSELN